jgi:hypothetical protein
VVAEANADKEARSEAVTAVLELLPEVNFFTLEHLVSHLRKCVGGGQARACGWRALPAHCLAVCAPRVAAHHAKNNCSKSVLAHEFAGLLLPADGEAVTASAVEVVLALLRLTQRHWTTAKEAILERQKAGLPTVSALPHTLHHSGSLHPSPASRAVQTPKRRQSPFKGRFSLFSSKASA